MAALATSSLTIPDQLLDPWLGKVQGASTVAALSAQTPMKFGAGESFTFDIGEAEYVGEGQPKGPTTPSLKKYRVGNFKFHKTVRMDQEVIWADEDHQLAVVQRILDGIQPALVRALDFGILHGINPTGGAKVADMPNLDEMVQSTVEYKAGEKPYVSLDAATDIVLGAGYVPSSVALDGTYASKFLSARSTQTEQKLYPGLKLDGVSELEGLRAAISRTVGAKGVAAAATNDLAFVGDFGAVRWGIQKELGLELIEYGDPDGQGDLKRHNQVAYRAEIVYGWGIADEGLSFARVIDAVA